MTRVVCWNMNYRRASWRTLAQMGADVASTSFSSATTKPAS